MRIKGLQSTREKPPDTDLEDNSKTDVAFCTTVEPITTKEGGIYSYLCGRFSITSIRGNKYIYVMYAYDCKAILMTAIENRSDKEMVRHFTELIED